ncbi:dihydrofolate reductase [Paenibacillaceae bacterium]|nr:dihydrofolate reductase [Paenibacillaceae bacterium]
MTITLIAAMGRNRTIGKDNKLPWKLPDDMAYFVRKTKGKTVLMGRKTLESFGKPLKNRTNIVLTRRDDFAQDGCIVAHSLDEAFVAAQGADVMVIGGEEIYRQALPFADVILLTEIDEEFEGDAHFPAFSADEWELADSIKGNRDDKNPYDYYFQTYKRRN